MWNSFSGVGNVSICSNHEVTLKSGVPRTLTLTPAASSRGCSMNVSPPPNHRIQIGLPGLVTPNLAVRYCELPDTSLVYILKQHSYGTNNNLLRRASANCRWTSLPHGGYRDFESTVEVNFPELQRTDAYHLVLSATGVQAYLYKRHFRLF